MIFKVIEIPFEVGLLTYTHTHTHKEQSLYPNLQSFTTK